jgi:hypothetical protein
LIAPQVLAASITSRLALRRASQPPRQAKADSNPSEPARAVSRAD